MLRCGSAEKDYRRVPAAMGNSVRPHRNRAEVRGTPLPDKGWNPRGKGNY